MFWRFQMAKTCFKIHFWVFIVPKFNPPVFVSYFFKNAHIWEAEPKTQNPNSRFEKHHKHFWIFQNVPNFGRKWPNTILRHLDAHHKLVLSNFMR